MFCENLQRTFKIVKNVTVSKKLIKFEIYLKIKNFKKILKILISLIKVCESFEQFKSTQ